MGLTSYFSMAMVFSTAFFKRWFLTLDKGSSISCFIEQNWHPLATPSTWNILSYRAVLASGQSRTKERWNNLPAHLSPSSFTVQWFCKVVAPKPHCHKAGTHMMLCSGSLCLFSDSVIKTPFPWQMSGLPSLNCSLTDRFFPWNTSRCFIWSVSDLLCPRSTTLPCISSLQAPIHVLVATQPDLLSCALSLMHPKFLCRILSPSHTPVTAVLSSRLPKIMFPTKCCHLCVVWGSVSSCLPCRSTGQNCTGI